MPDPSYLSARLKVQAVDCKPAARRRPIYRVPTAAVGALYVVCELDTLRLLLLPASLGAERVLDLFASVFQMRSALIASALIFKRGVSDGTADCLFRLAPEPLHFVTGLIGTAHGSSLSLLLPERGTVAYCVYPVGHACSRPRNNFPTVVGGWLHTYDFHRGHTALGSQPPAPAYLTSRVSTADM
jgi:hypothetical protein